MQKFNITDIKSFEFADLQSNHIVGNDKFEAFSFKSLQGETLHGTLPSEETISDERKFEREKSFQIDSIVRESRGINRQEKNELDIKINQEVKKKLEQTYEEAHGKGLELGRNEGLVEVQKNLEASSLKKLDELTRVINEVQTQANELVSKNHLEIQEFVKRFTKWIILKEINEKTYLTDLLEKLILELNARRNLIIRVGKENFSQMPEVLQIVQSKIGELPNVRVEIVSEIRHPGIILESENGLIDGSMEQIFENIDKIFEQVSVNE
jgi:flagellar assembly protein FliH